MKTYTKANDDVHDRVKALIKKHYPELEKARLNVDLLFVASDSEDGHPLTHGGYPAQAVVRVLGPKERTMDRGDAEIVIDEENYNGLSDEECDALLDHELYHIELTKDKNGRVKLDENGRPKLKMRKHDRQFGWFDEIAQRHGEHSFEVMQARRHFETGKQTYFAFLSDFPVAAVA